jgi:CTP:molybdopterin cytidylyltransferase MocA
MPLVTAAMIATIVERYRGASAPLIASEYLGVTAPPTLYDRGLFAELLATDAAGCARRVEKRHGHEAVRIAWPPMVLTDVDVPEDLERVASLLGVSHGGERHVC